MDQPGPSSQVVTRRTSETFRNHWFFGKLQDQLLQSVLPTKHDILKVYFYKKNFLLYLKNSRQLSDIEKDQILETLSIEVIELWQKSSIPLMDTNEVKKNLRKLTLKAEDFLKHRKIRNENNVEWIQENLKSYETLFDCAKCPHYKKKSKYDEIDETKPCQCLPHERISCLKPSENEFSDLQFYFDQKSNRKLIIGWSRDKKSTVKMRKTLNRQKNLEAEQSKMSKTSISQTEPIYSYDFDIDDSSNLNEKESNDTEFKPTNFEPKGERNNYEFPETIETARRYDLSNHALAAVINSHTNDLSVIAGFENPETYHVSTTKVKNMKNKYGNILIDNHSSEINSLECVGFDGKKGHSRAKNCKKEVLDKYTVVSQPEAKYVDHFVPRAGTALAISNDLLHVLEKYNSEDSITALLCDGCPVNTGLDRGVIRHVECEVSILQLNEY